MPNPSYHLFIVVIIATTTPLLILRLWQSPPAAEARVAGG
jgi:hypothetical protein